MALNIGNKVYRTLQEQVGFNAKQIDEIFKILDGLNIQDNVVAVSDISTPLTSEELEIINRAVAFIAYNGDLYIKRGEDATYAYFEVVFSLSVSGAVVSLNSKKITVALSNGALGYSTVSASTYTSSQIDTLVGAKADASYVNTELAKKANLSGAAFTGAVTAPTLSQSQANWSGTPSYIIPTGCAIGANPFVACKEINGILWLVAEIRVDNPTASDITGQFQIVLTSIPSSIGSRLYRREGSTVNTSPTGSTETEMGLCRTVGSGSGTPAAIKVLSAQANQVNAQLDITVTAGSYTFVGMRIPFVLL